MSELHSGERRSSSKRGMDALSQFRHVEMDGEQYKQEFSRFEQMNSQKIDQKTDVISHLKNKLNQIGLAENENKQASTQEFLQKRLEKVESVKQELPQFSDPQKLQQYFQNYKVHLNGVVNIKNINESKFLRLKLFKKSIYYGEVQNNTCTGKGIMLYYTGRQFEGDWQNDSKFGRGYELYPNGNAYEGQFVNGRPEGQGTYIWNNGEVYDGEWVNGMKHGNGEWMGTKGDNYVGEWKFGKADGKGLHRWINGDQYEGEFKSCLKHGSGEERFKNGDIYVGQYSNGRPEGFGEYLWNDGAYYKGDFKNGLRHGQGIWQKKKDGNPTDTFEGEYFNDKRCGYGIFKWASGNIYKGEYFEDLRHGLGEMHWIDSSYYKGDWQKGIQCGYGELFTPGEGLRKGVFANNTFKENGKDTNSIKNTMDDSAFPRRIEMGLSSKNKFMPNSVMLTEGKQDTPISNTKQGDDMPDLSKQRTIPVVTEFNTKLPPIKKQTDTLSGQDGDNEFYPNENEFGNGTTPKQDNQLKNNLDQQQKNSIHNEQQNETERRNSKESQSTKVLNDIIRGRSAQKEVLNKERSKQILPPIRGNYSDSKSQSTSQGNRNAKLRGVSAAVRGNSMNSINASKIQGKSPNTKQNREILLNKHEIYLWKLLRNKLCIRPKDLRDFTNPKQVEIIKNYIHPRIWLPTGFAHCLQSNSLSPSRSNSPQSSHLKSPQKRF